MYGASMMGADGKREPYYTRVKTGVHLTNYGGQAETAARAMGVTRHEAEKFQKRWFQIHPQILNWQKKVEEQLQTTRSVSNRFGFKRTYFDRMEGLLKEALAYIPQSTVGLVTNQGICNTRPSHLYSSPLGAHLYDPEVEMLRSRLAELDLQILLQVHDSIVFQYPTFREAEILPLLQRALAVIVPYDDPLVIPWGLKTSTISWGDAEERPWPAAL